MRSDDEVSRCNSPICRSMTVAVSVEDPSLGKGVRMTERVGGGCWWDMQVLFPF